MYRNTSKEDLRKLWKLIRDKKLKDAHTQKKHILSVFKEKHPDMDPGEIKQTPNRKKNRSTTVTWKDENDTSVSDSEDSDAYLDDSFLEDALINQVNNRRNKLINSTNYVSVEISEARGVHGPVQNEVTDQVTTSEEGNGQLNPVQNEIFNELPNSEEDIEQLSVSEEEYNLPSQTLQNKKDTYGQLNGMDSVLLKRNQ